MSWLAGITIDHTDNDNLGVDWVLQYEFGDLGMLSALTPRIPQSHHYSNTTNTS